MLSPCTGNATCTCVKTRQRHVIVLWFYGSHDTVYFKIHLSSPGHTTESYDNFIHLFLSGFVFMFFSAACDYDIDWAHLLILDESSINEKH